MNLEKVYQLTLKNFIYENNFQAYPKIIIFPKIIKIINLYYEMFNINKNIIFDDDPNNNNNKSIIIEKNKIINEYFKSLSVAEENFNINKIFENNNTPFYLCVQKYNKIENKYEKEIILLLNENEKMKKLEEIINIKKQNNFPNEQIFLKIYWNPIFSYKLKSYLRPEKIDSFLNQLIDFNEKNIINENGSNNSSNKNNKKIINEESPKSNKDKYFNFYSNLKKKNSERNNIITKFINTNNIYNLNKKEIKNNKIENFIQINQEISLNDTFEILREEELLDENNEWFCDNCKKKQRAIKKLEIYNAPKILIIQIKRFSHNNKINTKVNFPLTNLDINNYILSKFNDNIKYDLFAVANHYGSLYYGHYTAICKNSLDNKWYEYNDSYISETDESKVVSSNAYVLFYRQKDLSKLNWNKIYNKKYIEIDINDPSTLIDFNYDFINNVNNDKNELNCDEINDVNEFDKIIKNIYLDNKKLKNNQLINKYNENTNIENKNNIKEDNKNNKKDSNKFLAKKRSSSDSL